VLGDSVVDELDSEEGLTAARASHDQDFIAFRFAAAHHLFEPRDTRSPRIYQEVYNDKVFGALF